MEIDGSGSRRVRLNQSDNTTHLHGSEFYMTEQDKVSKILQTELLSKLIKVMQLESDRKMSAMMLRKSNIYKKKPKFIIKQGGKDRVRKLFTKALNN